MDLELSQKLKTAAGADNPAPVTPKFNYINLEDAIMYSIYEELNSNSYYLMDHYCVRKFAESCLEVAEDKKISYVKLVGCFYDWCEQMNIMRRVLTVPSKLWAEVCRQIEKGDLPYEAVQTQSGKRFLRGCTYKNVRK